VAAGTGKLIGGEWIDLHGPVQKPLIASEIFYLFFYDFQKYIYQNKIFANYTNTVISNGCSIAIAI
jgi:hypothetical protein